MAPYLSNHPPSPSPLPPPRLHAQTLYPQIIISFPVLTVSIQSNNGIVDSALFAESALLTASALTFIHSVLVGAKGEASTICKVRVSAIQYSLFPNIIGVWNSLSSDYAEAHTNNKSHAVCG